MASAGLIALGAVTVQTANAQMSGGSDKPWSLSGTLRGFYDDNYNTQPDGPLRRDSFGFEVRPSASVSWQGDVTTVTASYIYSMRFYEDRPTHRADHRHDFEGFLSHNFSEAYSLELSDSFVIAQEPELLNPSSPATGPFRSNGNNIRNTAGINLQAKVSSLLTLVLGYGNTLYDYEQKAADVAPGTVSRSGQLDRIEHAVTLNSKWQIMPETSLIFGYQFGLVDYTSDEVITTAGGTSSTRNVRTHTIYGGVDHTFIPELSGSVRVGAEIADFYNDPNNSTASVSPYADLSLTWKYMDTGSFILGFRHSRNATDVVGTTATGVTATGGLTLDSESSVVYASLVHKITPDLTGTLTGQYQNSSFKGGASASGDDNFYLLGLNLSYQFNRYLAAEIGYNYDKLTSGVHPGYDRNRVYLGVTASY